MREGQKKLKLDTVINTAENVVFATQPAEWEIKPEIDGQSGSYDQSVIYRVGNITINKVSMDQLKRAIKEKDITHITTFLDMFIAEAEKNQEPYKQIIQESKQSFVKSRLKTIEYTDNTILKFMSGEIIDIRDEQTPDNHITRTTRLVVEPVNTNIELPIGSLLTTPDQRFAIIKRNSQTVYESVEYLR